MIADFPNLRRMYLQDSTTGWWWSKVARMADVGNYGQAAQLLDVALAPSLRPTNLRMGWLHDADLGRGWAGTDFSPLFKSPADLPIDADRS